MCGQAPVPLGSARSYAVLAGSAVTNAGPSALTGDLGVSPAATVTGFPPGTLTGTENISNPAAAAAQVNLTIAFNDAMGRNNCPITVAGDIGGQTLTPGLYASTSTLTIASGDLTLNGEGNSSAVFLFQVGSALSITGGRAIILTHGTQAANVFWVVGSSATFAAGSTTEGTVMVAASITMAAGTQMDGRALAESATVTLSDTTIVVPTLAPPSTYGATFTEAGLPSGTLWFANVTGHPSVSKGVASGSDTITVAGLVNGTYSFTVAVNNKTWYTSAASGSFTISGANDPSAGSSTYDPFAAYRATFTETGIATGTNWTVTLNGVVESSPSSAIAFPGIVNGTYRFDVASVLGYVASPLSGVLTVNGADVSQVIEFTPILWGPYVVTFTETGLVTGTSWTVTLNGAAESGVGSSIAFPGIVNGTYGFSVGLVSGFIASPLSGVVAINGADVSQAVVFTPIPKGTYLATFTETGLATGTSWTVTLNGAAESGVGSSIAFPGILNGTYGFSIGSVGGFIASPLSGVLRVNGADASQAIAFTPVPPGTYVVTFTETGLATGTGWAVTWNGVAGSSVGSSMAFPGILNGTYGFSVGSVSGFIASPVSGVLRVNGAGVSQAIVFTPIPPGTYVVTFTEIGLATGAGWTVTLNGAVESSGGSSTAFPGILNGTYGFSVGSVSGFIASPVSGVVAVNGADAGQAIVFTPVPPGTYVVTFTETGLTTGTRWAVTWNGVAESSVGSSMAFSGMVNGTYGFSVGSVTGFVASPVSGVLVVNGAWVSQAIVFTLVPPGPFVVTFTETGLAMGTSWTVTLNGVAGSSVNGSIVFPRIVNGTYRFSVGSVTGFTASPPSGAVTVNDADVSQAIVFTSTGGAATSSGGIPLLGWVLIGAAAVAAVAAIGMGIVLTRRSNQSP
jgi:hypothetical protein